MTGLVKHLGEAAFELATICKQIDEHDSDEIDRALVDDFQNALGDVVAAVERRKAFIKAIDERIVLAKDYRDRGASAVKSLERLRERTIDATKQVVAQNPDIPFEDALGKKLKVSRNQPKLVVTGNWKDSKFTYIQEEICLDKQALKEYLLSGEVCEFAHLESGTQLRGLK